MNDSAQLFDSSVWIALSFGTHPFHQPAREAFERADADRPAVFCRATQQTFLRLLTTPALHETYGCDPISNQEAWAAWETLAKLPQVGWIEEPPDLETRWQAAACLPQPAPKRWMDAYLAALATGHGIGLVTLDRGFRQFPGLRLHLIGDVDRGPP